MGNQSEEDALPQVPVVYVSKQHAKIIKVSLEKEGLLNKNFRMVPAKGLDSCIAIPVIDSYHDKQAGDWIDFVVSVGMQNCPFSTKLGNRKTASLGRAEMSYTLVQQAILKVMENVGPNTALDSDNVVLKLDALGSVVCPKKLATFGDDRTLVVPTGAFEGDPFFTLLTKGSLKCDREDVLVDLWQQLLKFHDSKRIVRKGVVDPDSGVRQSGHRLLFPSAGVAEKTGPGSPGWICVTEQGIRQSFDMTRVMFSRGNISEKIRFGKVVKEGERVLDMYAGIGFYTLPALVHGKADHVVACEWNEHAANALRYNVSDNKLDGRVTVLQGDCRVLAVEHALVDQFDRVSLGLLPSCEGGWKFAVNSLRKDRGGWLHVHANVPNKEKLLWTEWMCVQLSNICKENGRPIDWIVLCTHVEKVKSFAPTVSHFVADVFVGDRACQEFAVEIDSSRVSYVIDGNMVSCSPDVSTPSCALSPDGVLSQEWMR